MIVTIAFLLFFIGCTRIYTGVQDLCLLGNAIEMTATVTEIEEVITEDEHGTYYAYFLHLLFGLFLILCSFSSCCLSVRFSL